jgi:hypothetical protein
MNWDAVQQIHTTAAQDVVAAAERVPADRWLQPRAEGKWSPAEVLEHLSLAYDVLLRELAGGEGMAIRTKLWQRILLRFTIVPGILRGGAFPKGARAPRETRPALTTTDQRAAIAAFRDRAARLAAAASDAQSRRGVKLTHAYFGRASVCDSLLLCARHLQHHQQQLGSIA